MTKRIVNPKGDQFGIRINSERQGALTRIERELLYEEIARYYLHGLSDLQIAEAAGCADKTVRRWRYRNGLPSIYGKVHEE